MFHAVSMGCPGPIMVPVIAVVPYTTRSPCLKTKYCGARSVCFVSCGSRVLLTALDGISGRLWKRSSRDQMLSLSRRSSSSGNPVFGSWPCDHSGCGSKYEIGIIADAKTLLGVFVSTTSVPSSFLIVTVSSGKNRQWLHPSPVSSDT